MGQSKFNPSYRNAPGRKLKSTVEKYEALYDRAWRSYRKRFLAINSKCYACDNYAKVVDHLIPHKGSVKLFKKLDNHLPLCEKCHNTITALFDMKYIEGQDISMKLRWLHDARMRMPLEKMKRVKVLAKYED